MSGELDDATAIIQERAGPGEIEFAIVVGAGLSESVDRLENEISIPYADLPGFPKTASFGQEFRLMIGEMEGTRVAVLKGREHYFENANPCAMALPLEVMAMLGAGTIIITSTAGSVDADLFPGMLCVVTDHINFNGVNPLVGVHNDGGTVSMTRAYDERHNGRMKRGASTSGVPLHEGVFMLFSGPSFETPAEVRMARQLGVQLIGTAGVHEVILARRLGLRVCSVSAITYFGAGFNKSDPTYIETRDIARQSAISLRRLLRAFMRTKEGIFTAEAKPSLLRKPILP